eukprot:TRINITY_DN68645_c0_g1_i1.p1 TRINITY_DN68645_c0_g1~~TRINITY_DN68645_c0_g1_i1.p1  ORF type:complete len:151 (-),score=16.08 TRINITY_DN68645_c0_g1_i1:259-711(-)
MYHCVGSPPGDDKTLELVNKFDLSLYTTDDLHQLVRCLGLLPRSGAGSVSDAIVEKVQKGFEVEVASASVPEKVCRRLMAVVPWWQSLGAAGVLSCTILVCSCIIVRMLLTSSACARLMRRGKLKTEDGVNVHAPSRLDDEFGDIALGDL